MDGDLGKSKIVDIRNISFSPNNKIHKVPKLRKLKEWIFNADTKWKDDDLPKFLIEYGKNPPYLENLHSMGLKGDGVTVAIIDQPLALNHPEYDGKILKYKNFCENSKESSMHGPAVTSLLVGENIGVAPHANVVYAAIPTWFCDANYAVQALEWIIEENKKLPKGEKIKFVSVSAGFGVDRIFRHSENWNALVEKAQKNGLCIVECTEGKKFISSGYVDVETKEFKYGFPSMPMRMKQVGNVHVPCSMRTVAESYDNKNFSYTYSGVGGLSWAIPYAVGLLAIGQQINKNMSAFDLKNILIETASENECVVDPDKFAERVKSFSKESKEIVKEEK